MKSVSVILCVAVVSISGKPTENRKISDDLQAEASSHNGIVGIATIAGVASRNSRVSSVRGIQYFPGPDTVNEYIYPLEYFSESDNTYPLTVSTERNGRYASGTIQVNPGYISASARAGFGSPSPESRIGFNPPNAGLQRPFKDLFFQSRPEIYRPRNWDNWFSKDLFQEFRPSAPEVIRNGWIVPNFNPFMNYWR